jgi:hypothetical protein
MKKLKKEKEKEKEQKTQGSGVLGRLPKLFP